jgi:hypothetical protein
MVSTAARYVFIYAETECRNVDGIIAANPAKRVAGLRP